MSRDLLSELRRQLEGRRIDKVILLSRASQEAAFGFASPHPCIALRLDDGTYVSVLADAEGNGPGFLDVSPPVPSGVL